MTSKTGRLTGKVMTMGIFEVQQVKPLIGAVVETDKETLLSGRPAKQIREMLDDRGVIVGRL